MSQKYRVDRQLLLYIVLIVVFGLVIFLSASLGILARAGVEYSSIVLNQIVLGLFCGGIMAFITSKLPYKFWKIYSFWFFSGALLLTALVFIPGIGSEFGGARRWIWLGPLSFQPSELLKIAYLIYLAALFSSFKKRIKTFRYGTLPLIILSVLAGGLLMAQPDNDTAIIMLVTGCIMYFVAGGSWRYIIVAGLIGTIAVGFVLSTRTYVVDRLITYIDPSADSLNSGYQIQQSLIAIGSGGLFGRGFGQSVQKFGSLPEPVGDSIFAVAAEEFGFVGSFVLISLFVLFLYRSIKLSLIARESFGGLLMLGLAILIVLQSFVNMGSMLGLLPLSGLPLLFVSHGGTALFFTLFASGIMLNISRFKNRE